MDAKTLLRLEHSRRELLANHDVRLLVREKCKIFRITDPGSDSRS